MSVKEKIMIVDGYNVINSWQELKEISQKDSLDRARDRLNQIMSEFANFAGYKVIVVYDAYNVRNSQEREYSGKNIKIVYTKEKETADTYIEKLISSLGNKRYLEITVATDDQAEQQIVIGKGGIRISTLQLKIEVENKQKKLKSSIKINNSQSVNSMMGMIHKDVREELEKMRKSKSSKKD